MSFWTDLDPTNPRSRFWHPVKERRFRRMKEIEGELGLTGMQLYDSKPGGAINEESFQQAKAAIDRRDPFGAGQGPDYTDALLRQVRVREMERLGVGKTRSSLFTVSPAAAILTGGYGK